MSTVQSIREWLGESFSSFRASGGTPTTTFPASLTTDPFATRAALLDGNEWHMVVQDPAAVGPFPGDGDFWIALHRSEVDAVAGWTRQADTHYIWQQNATLPADPPGALVFSHITILGGLITGEHLTSPSAPVRSETVASGHYATGVVADGVTDNWDALQRALNTHYHITLPAGVIAFSQTLTLRSGQRLEGAGIGEEDVLDSGTRLLYTGTGTAILYDGTVSTFNNAHIILSYFSLRSLTGQVGIQFTNFADFDMSYLLIEGRLQTGGVITGFTTAGLIIDAPAGGIAITTRIKNSYVISCVGDGIQLTGAGILTTFSLFQSRIQGNQGWGVNVTTPAEGVVLVGTDVEGNALGQIHSTRPLSWDIAGCYFEHPQPVPAVVLGTAAGLPGRGINITGCSFNQNTVASLDFGSVTPIGNVFVAGNRFGTLNGIGINFNNEGVFDSTIGPNSIEDLATLYTGKPGAGVTIIDRVNTHVLMGGSDAIVTDVVNQAARGTIGLQDIPAYLISGAGGFRLNASGTYLNNTGIAQALTISLFFNNTLIANFPFTSITASALARAWTLSVHAFGDAAGDDIIRVVATADLSVAGGADITPNPTPTTRLMMAAGPFTSELTTVVRQLLIGAQHSSADPNLSLTRWAYHTEFIWR